MDSRTTIPVTQLRKELFKVINDVAKKGTNYTITEKGKTKAVILSAEEFESWQETFEVMKEFPDLKDDIKKAEGEYKRGEYITLDELLEENGYIVADKQSKKYVVSSHPSKKNKKRISNIR